MCNPGGFLLGLRWPNKKGAAMPTAPFVSSYPNATLFKQRVGHPKCQFREVHHKDKTQNLQKYEGNDAFVDLLDGDGFRRHALEIE
jgi:hypothetical protein